MRKILIIVIVLFSIRSTCQNFSASDITMTFKGLTAEYQQYFNNNYNSLIETMNKMSGLDKSIVPISLNITYDNDQGYIQLIVNYDHKKQMGIMPEMLRSLINSYQERGSNLISIYLPDLLMLCLNDFKDDVYKSSKFNNEVKKFQIAVRLEKADGSWIQFYCNEFVDYYGIPRYSFADYADIMIITDKVCQITALNGSNLDNYKLWELGNLRKPDGSKNCDNNAFIFFEIDQKSQ